MRALGMLLLVMCISTASAAEPGMFLRASPVIANNFWNDLLTAQQAGVHLNRDIAASIAQKDGCPFIASDSLKPIDFIAGELAITNGI
jgi:hypothetical protein